MTTIEDYMADEPELILPKNVNYQDLEDRFRFHADMTDLYWILNTNLKGKAYVPFDKYADNYLKLYDIKSNDLYENMLRYQNWKYE